MRKTQRLHPTQRTWFLEDGFLVIQGTFSQGMIADLLDALDEEEYLPLPPVETPPSQAFPKG